MKAIVALGGNALTGKDRKADIKKQFEETKNTAKSIAKMVKNGWHIAITHGNAPQIGALLLQQKTAINYFSPMPMHVLGALTQGQIGYIIQQCLLNEFKRQGIRREISTIITQVLVDENDEAFKNPTKPIGPLYSDEEARKMKEKYVMGRVEGGWRILVASPKPLSIVESNIIKKMIEENIIVIAGGGGGIPVVKKGNEIHGVDAVIDKDFASQKLANEIGAEILLILTDVEYVCLNYGKENEQLINDIGIDELEKYYKEGHFPPGSMGPKIEASINFIKNGGKEAIITSIEKAWDALEGRTGTHIHE
ncbi:MAG TPA: carbamate kinase [Thermoplasmatales archaeon]|nr:carbamate kinase [Thermoplasmatales archaeon]